MKKICILVVLALCIVIIMAEPIKVYMCKQPECTQLQAKRLLRKGERRLQAVLVNNGMATNAADTNVLWYGLCNGVVNTNAPTTQWSQLYRWNDGTYNHWYFVRFRDALAQDTFNKVWMANKVQLIEAKMDEITTNYWRTNVTQKMHRESVVVPR